MENKSIAIIIQNVVQWYSVRPIVKYLIKNKIPLDLLVYDPGQISQDYHDIASDVTKTINQDGFKTANWPDSKAYYLVLAPYSDMINFKCKYRLSYCYGAATTKPMATLQPDHKMGFHAFLLHDTYGAELLSVYGRTYIVPDLYLSSIKHKKQSKKTVVLYLPTYNEPSVPDVALALSKLKSDFYIITKGHHGIDHLSEEQNKKNILMDISDEYYHSDYFIKPLLEKADVVLSDNSGAAMDALYSKVPVAIATSKLSPKINGIKPIQQELIESKVIPYANEITPQNIKNVINQALNPKQILSQSAASDKLFPVKKGGAKIWFNIIQQYLNDEIDQNYYKLHDYYVEQWNTLKTSNLKLTQENQMIQNDLLSLKNELSIYRNSFTHKAIEKVLRHHHQKNNN